VHGVLEGWVTFGPRADGRPYSNADRDDALMLVRLFSRLLGQHRQLKAATAVQKEVSLLKKFGPRFCVVGANGKTEEVIPVEAREVAALAIRDGKRIEREFGRVRVTAGPIPGIGGCWVWWDDSAPTAEATAQKREAERHQILHDLGIMISHELANAMFSVSTYFQHLKRQRATDDTAHPLIERVGQDMERMKAMPHLLSTLYEMSKQPTARVDMKRIIQSVAKEVGGIANTPDSPLLIWGHEKNLHDALIWLCREIVSTKDRVETVSRDAKITISLQQRRRDDESICLVTIAYPGLRVDQIKVGEATTTEEYPTVPVYLAREVIRFHFRHGARGPGPRRPGAHDRAKVAARERDRRGRPDHPQAGRVRKRLSVQAGRRRPRGVPRIGMSERDEAWVANVSAWASAQADIKALVQIGSRVKNDGTADKWSDFDYQLITTNPARYKSGEFARELGKCWAIGLEHTFGDVTKVTAVFDGALEADFIILRHSDLVIATTALGWPRAKVLWPRPLRIGISRLRGAAGTGWGRAPR
jgi:hypothetical protein